MDGSITMTTIGFAAVITAAQAFLFVQLAQLHGRITRSREDAKQDVNLVRQELDAFKLEVAKQYPSSELIVELNGSIRDLTRTLQNGGGSRVARRKS